MPSLTGPESSSHSPAQDPAVREVREIREVQEVPEVCEALEVSERFSFLGMQAILVLYFRDTVTHGGLGIPTGTASSVSAAHGTLVHPVTAVGGRLSDRVPGSYRAVLWGGLLIACGRYAMAAPAVRTTWVGLGLISAGTGLLKPNVATMVGKLSRTDDGGGTALAQRQGRDVRHVRHLLRRLQLPPDRGPRARAARGGRHGLLDGRSL